MSRARLRHDATDHAWGYRGPHKLVLLAIARYYSSDVGYAWPSMEQLAGRCDLCERQLRRAFRYLESAGELRVEPGIGRQRSRYFYLFKDRSLLFEHLGADTSVLSEGTSAAVMMDTSVLSEGTSASSPTESPICNPYKHTEKGSGDLLTHSLPEQSRMVLLSLEEREDRDSRLGTGDSEEKEIEHRRLVDAQIAAAKARRGA